jgi:hypothetical protein
VLVTALVVSAALDANAQAIDRARDLVDPFIGTGGHGHTFPGACVPNGLVQLSPDTRPDGMLDWDGCGGYHYSDSVIYGFSHTHLSGTGVADLCDVLLMPLTGSQAGEWSRVGLRQKFDHANEQAHAGYYRVKLVGPPQEVEPHAAVDVELTATPRVGMHRYTFGSDQARTVVIDLAHRDKLLSGDVKLISAREAVGVRRSSSWAKDQQLFFVIRFSQDCMDPLDVPPANGVEQVYEPVTERGFRFQDPGRRRYPRTATHLLHRALPQLCCALRLQRCGRQLPGHGRPGTPCGPQRVYGLQPVGHLPRVAPFDDHPGA